MRRGPGDKGEQAGRFTSYRSLSWNVCLEGRREGPWGVGQGNKLSGSVIGEEEEFPLQVLLEKDVVLQNLLYLIVELEHLNKKF